MDLAHPSYLLKVKFLIAEKSMFFKSRNYFHYWTVVTDLLSLALLSTQIKMLNFLPDDIKANSQSGLQKQ